MKLCFSVAFPLFYFMWWLYCMFLHHLKRTAAYLTTFPLLNQSHWGLFAAPVVVLDRPFLAVCTDEVLQACENSLQLPSVDTLHLKLFFCPPSPFREQWTQTYSAKAWVFMSLAETFHHYRFVLCKDQFDILGNLLSCRELDGIYTTLLNMKLEQLVSLV